MEKRDDFIGEIRRMLEEFTAFASMLSTGALPMPTTNPQAQLHEDALETDDEYILTLELPGASADDVNVKAGRRFIQVNVENTTSDVFPRSYPTEVGIKPKQLNITLKNGILEVRAPKK